MCGHVKLILDADGVPKFDLPKVVAADFGEEGVVGLGSKVVGMGRLGEKDLHAICRLAESAGQDGVALAVRLGDTQTYAVLHADDPSVPGDWAHVQTSDVARTARKKAAASRRTGITAVPQFLCKVSTSFAVVFLIFNHKYVYWSAVR